MRRLLTSFLGNNRAAAAAEMALILPMAMALLFGGFEGGSYLWVEHKVIKGVRDGARYAGRQSFSNFSCGSPDIVEGDVDTKIKNVVRTGTPDATRGARFPSWTDNDDIAVIVSCDADTTGGIYEEDFPDGGPRVLVSAVVPYPSILGTLGFDTSGAVVRAQAQAAVMGL